MLNRSFILALSNTFHVLKSPIIFFTAIFASMKVADLVDILLKLLVLCYAL